MEGKIFDYLTSFKGQGSVAVALLRSLFGHRHEIPILIQSPHSTLPHFPCPAQYTPLPLKKPPKSKKLSRTYRASVFIPSDYRHRGRIEPSIVTHKRKWAD